ncbi:CHAP domain-containing protein, partial [Enterococcus faecalis]|nr:CHAP domain-containing protein [Enterococcus faecalis]
ETSEESKPAETSTEETSEESKPAETSTEETSEESKQTKTNTEVKSDKNSSVEQNYLSSYFNLNPSTTNTIDNFFDLIASDYEKNASKLKEYKTNQVGKSNLLKYELPLISTYKNKNNAALVYEVVSRVEEKYASDKYSNESLLNLLFKQLFNTVIDTLDTQLLSQNDLLEGDILYDDKDKLLGIYIGQNYVVSYRNELTDKEKGTEGEIQLVELENSQTTQKYKVCRINENEMKLTEYGEDVLKRYPASLEIKETKETKEFINKISTEAQKFGQDYDVFASVMIAQAILESQSGTSLLSDFPNYNLFGMKGEYEDQSVSFITYEDDGKGNLYPVDALFRKYPDYASSLSDYVKLIRGGIYGEDTYYKNVWRSESKNYLRSSIELTGKYATDIDYYKKISSLIAVYHLTEYDQAPLSTSGQLFIQKKEEIPESYIKAMKYEEYNGIDYNVSKSYPEGQCTWYVYNRVKQIGKYVDEYMGNGGDWGSTGQKLGYKVTNKPKPGLVISFSPNAPSTDSTYGHVAFVEAVIDEGILISEGNVIGGNAISYRVIGNDLAYSDLVSYIEPQ